MKAKKMFFTKNFTITFTQLMGWPMNVMNNDKKELKHSVKLKTIKGDLTSHNKQYKVLTDCVCNLTIESNAFE